MANIDLQKLHKLQQKTIALYKEKDPNLLENQSQINVAELLKSIGISNIPEKNPEGFIYLFPQDFIIEEEFKGNQISALEFAGKQNRKPLLKTKYQIHVDLIKIQVSTKEVIDYLSEKLNIASDLFGYTSNKDIFSLSSQKISIPNTTFEQLKKTETTNFFFQNPSYQSQKIDASYLENNIYTVVIRTKDPFDPNKLKDKLSEIKQKGFLNYFPPQNFSYPRFINHKIGYLILQQEYQQAVEKILTYSQNEIPLIAKLRSQAFENLGEWREIKRTFSQLPYTLVNELKILSYLEENPDDFKGLFLKNKDLANSYINAYIYFQFNKLVSENSANKNLQREAPLIFPDKDIYNFYKNWAGIPFDIYLEGLMPFKEDFEKTKKVRKTRAFPQDILAVTQKDYVILSFKLKPETSPYVFLSYNFELIQGKPLPNWLRQEFVDSKKDLKLGSSKKILKQLNSKK